MSCYVDPLASSTRKHRALGAGGVILSSAVLAWGLPVPAAAATVGGLQSGALAQPGAAASVVSAACSGGVTGWCPSPAYLQPTTRIDPARGGNRLTKGWTGVKVGLVQRALGMGSRWESYDTATIAAVRRFQKGQGLPVTGVVDARTWRAARISAPWTVDGWQTHIRVTPSATRSQRVEALVGYAKAQVGWSYTWGGAGYSRLGFDCSGLVLQSLYAAGMDPRPVNVVRHQSPGYVTTQHLYTHPKLQRVGLAQRQRGDLIFWGRRGVTTHVAVYLGRGRVIEAVQPVVRAATYSSRRGRSVAMPYVVRPLADS